MGTKNNPGNFDCHHAALPDEPMFVLLARDPAAPATVRFWMGERARLGKNEDADDLSKLGEAAQCAEGMESWRSRNLDPTGDGLASWRIPRPAKSAFDTDHPIRLDPSVGAPQAPRRGLDETTVDLRLLLDRFESGNLYEDHDEATRLLGVLQRHVADLEREPVCVPFMQIMTPDEMLAAIMQSLTEVKTVLLGEPAVIRSDDIPEELRGKAGTFHTGGLIDPASVRFTSPPLGGETVLPKDHPLARRIREYREMTTGPGMSPKEARASVFRYRAAYPEATKLVEQAEALGAKIACGLRQVSADLQRWASAKTDNPELTASGRAILTFVDRINGYAAELKPVEEDGLKRFYRENLGVPYDPSKPLTLDREAFLRDTRPVAETAGQPFLAKQTPAVRVELLCHALARRGDDCGRLATSVLAANGIGFSWDNLEVLRGDDLALGKAAAQLEQAFHDDCCTELGRGLEP